VDKILNSANPADLPVEQPTKLKLVFNLKRAKELGLVIPRDSYRFAAQIGLNRTRVGTPLLKFAGEFRGCDLARGIVDANGKIPTSSHIPKR
jgi:hypothetical protein